MESFVSSHAIDRLMSADEQDMLRELINVAYGHAVSSISILLDAFATLHIPEIILLEASDLEAYIERTHGSAGSQFYLASQKFRGDVGGETLFVIDSASAVNLTVHITNCPNKEDYLNDAVMELGNILSSATISKLAENFGFPVVFSAPTIERIAPSSPFDTAIPKLKNFTHVVIIQTLLEFRDQEIRGEMMILLENRSFEVLQRLLAHKIEELLG